MMGIKQQHVAPLERITWEQLVPKDHVYRQVERTLDLSFVRDLVAPSGPLQPPNPRTLGAIAMGRG